MYIFRGGGEERKRHVVIPIYSSVVVVQWWYLIGHSSNELLSEASDQVEYSTIFESSSSSSTCIRLDHSFCPATIPKSTQWSKVGPEIWKKKARVMIKEIFPTSHAETATITTNNKDDNK